MIISLCLTPAYALIKVGCWKAFVAAGHIKPTPKAKIDPGVYEVVWLVLFNNMVERAAVNDCQRSPINPLDNPAWPAYYSMVDMLFRCSGKISFRQGIFGTANPGIKAG